MPPGEDSEFAAPPSPRKQDDISTAAVDPRGTVEAAAPPEGEDDGIVMASEFSPGDVLSDRYRVVRFIARGGMGEVYEVEDLTLLGTLALKTIRPEIARDKVAVERFKREINIARRITHPNVSRVYDVGVHHVPVETMFLTMEYLPGETLSDRIRKRGRLTTEEALPFAEQICAGLAAAHDAGIIHRDFKSPNVMLVKHGNATRAIVTDFGLARSSTNEAGMVTISDAGAIMGTPAYMAPEQVEGKRLTPAADIYALGIVLYEMLTARRPFQADSPLSLAIKRLTEPPVPPSRYVPDIDPVWESVIMRCLARDPEQRFTKVIDVVLALRAGEVVTPPTARYDARPGDEVSTLIVAGERNVRSEQARDQSAAPSVTKSRAATVIQFRTRKMAVAGATVITLAVAGAISYPWRKPSSPVAGASVAAAQPAVAIRPGLAILGLRTNSTLADDWLGTAITEMMVTDLSAGEKVRVASAESVARLRSDEGFSDPSSLTVAQLQRVRLRLGADSVVNGTVTTVGSSDSQLVRIDLRLIDTKSGEVLEASGASGAAEQLFDLVGRAIGPIRQRLKLPARSPSEATQVAAALPTDPETFRLYAEGLASLRSLDAAKGLELLEKASQRAEHPLVLSAMSAAYSALGDSVRAKEAAVRSVALSGRLARELKLLNEARLHEASSDWPKAIDVYRTLAESFPDNVDYGVSLGAAQTSGGNSNEALVTVAALRRLPKPLSDDGRIDLVEARAYQELRDFKRELSLARIAAKKGRDTGARLVVARARMLEATAHLQLGDMAAAMTAVDDARALFTAAGDRGNVARALELTATAVDRQGDLAGERRLLDEALKIHRAVGDKSSAARVLVNIGTLLIAQGRPAEAEPYFDEAVAAFRQLGVKYGLALTLNNIGAMSFNRGDLAAAEKRYRDALTVFGEIGDQTGTATTLTNIAEVLECGGRLVDARQLHEESLAISRTVGDKEGIAYDLFRLGEIFAIRGELVAARERYQEALSVNSSIGDKLGAADARLALAALEIEQGGAANAEKVAREAEEILRTEGAAERSIFAQAVVADALLAQGRNAEAHAIATRAWKAAEQSEDRRVRFKVAVTAARAMATSAASRAAALNLLRAAAKDAAATKFVVAELDARLTIAEIEAAAGSATARRRIEAMEREAVSQGFGRLARRAAALKT